MYISFGGTELAGVRREKYNTKQKLRTKDLKGSWWTNKTNKKKNKWKYKKKKKKQKN